MPPACGGSLCCHEGSCLCQKGEGRTKQVAGRTECVVDLPTKASLPWCEVTISSLVFSLELTGSNRFLELQVSNRNDSTFMSQTEWHFGKPKPSTHYKYVDLVFLDFVIPIKRTSVLLVSLNIIISLVLGKTL